MASGKSVTAPRVGALLGLPTFDLDEEVASEAGAPVEVIFAREGEAGFRRREHAALARVVGRGPSVIALGGGTLHQPGCRDLLTAGFDVVVLDTPWPVIEQRLARSDGRPLAGAARTLFEQRRAGYLAAGRQVATEGKSPEKLAGEVVAALEERRAAG